MKSEMPVVGETYITYAYDDSTKRFYIMKYRCEGVYTYDDEISCDFMINGVLFDYPLNIYTNNFYSISDKANAFEKAVYIYSGFVTNQKVKNKYPEYFI